MRARSRSTGRVLVGAAMALGVGAAVAALEPGDAGAEGGDRGPARMTIDRLPGGKSSPFDHYAHAERAACGDCHHTGRNVSCSAAGCHPVKAAGPGSMELKTAFHKQCIPCHARTKASTKCSGPGSCHPPSS